MAHNNNLTPRLHYITLEKADSSSEKLLRENTKCAACSTIADLTSVVPPPTGP
jgi:hypothetical protein